MKLDCGQLITPRPWPIHNRPMASAIRPRTRSNLRIGVSSFAWPRGGRATAARVARPVIRGKSGDDGSDCSAPFHGGVTKKPRTMPGLLQACREIGSVLRDHRASPVEAIDQRGRDGLHEGLEGDRVAKRKAGGDGGLGKRRAIEVGGAILGLHEPARSRDAEDVQAVLDAATDEPTITIE